MAEKTCECKGVDLFRDIIDVTLEFVENPENPMLKPVAAKLAEETYSHLLEQSNKTGSAALSSNVQPLMERIRKGLSEHQAEPILALEVVRDSIHKSPGLQQLLVCGGPYDVDNPDSRTEAAKVIGQVCDMFGNTDDDVKPILNTLWKSLNCEEPGVDELRRKMAQEFK